ncbi:MAG: hypothetical protein JSR78_00185 [Proteobacteria bacterium]|nr:hypothetical protein [Pseudomonadota bacterium]
MAIRVKLDSLLPVARANDDAESACGSSAEIRHEADGNERAKSEYKKHQVAEPLVHPLRSSDIPSDVHLQPCERG